MMQNRHVKPLPAEEYKFTVPEIQSLKLNNGLTILLVERHVLPIVRVNMVTESGSRFDPNGKKGLSNLLAMSIDEGAGELDAFQLSDEFNLLGSDFDIHCTNDSMYFLSRSLQDNIWDTMEMFSSVILKPHLKENDFLKEKRKVLTRLMQLKDDPDEIASNAFENLIFNRDHIYAYPVPGLEEDIAEITIDDIKSFYKNRMLSADSHLIFAGDIDMNEAEKITNKFFHGWSSKILTNGVAEETSCTPGLYIIDKPGSVQTEIRIGHLTKKRDSLDYFHRMLMNLILGGQFSSRINLNLRENKGYTYGAFTNFNYYRDSGYFYASTSVGVENTWKAVNEINEELKRIRDGVLEEELLFAKTSIIRKFPSNFETNGQIASSITRMILYNLPNNHFDHYIQLVHDVTIEQVNNAAVEYIHPEKMIMLLVGDKKEILKQLGSGKDITELNLRGDLIQ